MSDHLPECGVRKPCGVCGNITYAVCICDRLRACEQRVRKNLSLVRVSVEDDPKELERIATFEFQRTADVRSDELAKTLDAAREAIAALPWNDAEWLEYVDGANPERDALAAIDALRKETK